ncbi:cytoplasmic tRNA 2-thiolation protein 2 [Elysia marginata]|uniref:Cytoplasmic tRNA 2-thiolation protein 2 n=1 Tax=Elysia marginata TaxID=1093978 RepID=A0AAV4G925_9GAST|nr:cytoplasmic tRNA 2-thiolation protein 2 [Elysia marginata]
MCNVADEGDNTESSSNLRNSKSLANSGCVKCGEPGVLITRIHDSFCKSCFQVYVVHKFRSAIGKSKLIRDGETVLVAFSGGTNSSALLHLIQDGLSLRAHKRLRFTPTLIHVDESCVFGNRSDELKQKREQIRQIMLKSGFPSYWMQLGQSLDICTDHTRITSKSTVSEKKETSSKLKLDYLGKDQDFSLEDPSIEESEKLQDLIKSFKSPSAQEDFLLNLKNQLLVVAARQLGFSKILTAESSTRLAVRILSDVAQGRGSQLSLDTGISDERNTGVMFMRPVRELNAKELAMYNSLFEVESVFMPSLTTKTSMSSSIERLTETFVTGLQADFPSTVSNIVR